ncbi:unnamed protein product [Staurois parvus]|uniref:Uncharacterized protein n=1 Tax=Staurois parvus TaxID=386267 RepID=A0ABN9E633_9NEOB|nr:unnamed protein product [Staurois parvus]
MYVKWVETAMFYYVKFVWKKKMTFFKIFKFPVAGGARTSRRHRDRNTEAGCRHRPEEMAGDAAGDTSWGAKDKVSSAGTP